MSGRYRVFSHTADTGIEAEAPTLADIYATCAYGMFDLMVELEGLTAVDEVVVRAAAGEPSQVLVDLLSELLATSEIDGVVFCTFATRTGTETEVEIVAGAVPVAEVELRGPPIKAVTYHDLTVAPTATGWFARVLFDV